MPENVVDILEASLSTSTRKQYQCSLVKWLEFCSDRKINCFNPGISDLLVFLRNCFDNGASYGTLNSTKCAISLITQNKIGNNGLVSRFMSGLYNLRPTKTKYAVTWDVNIVLNYLENLPDTTSLNLKDLTLKTVTLLALITAQRSQTLAKISIKNIQETETGMEIIIHEKIKTSAPGRPSPILLIPRCNIRKNLCIYTCISTYLRATRNIRGDYDSLFIAMKSPFKPVGSQTIARWIKETLNLAGIDTKVFSGHSTRHAATSAALSRGVDLEVIKKAAGWTKDSRIFFQFYNRPITRNEASFAQAILEANN